METLITAIDGPNWRWRWQVWRVEDGGSWSHNIQLNGR